MSLNLNQLPDQISESPSLESLTVAETYSTLLNYHIRNAELQRFLKDTTLRTHLVYIFSAVIFLWLASTITILYFNKNLLNLNLSDNVLITLLTTTTINVIGMMLIILRNLFPSLAKISSENNADK